MLVTPVPTTARRAAVNMGMSARFDAMMMMAVAEGVFVVVVVVGFEFYVVAFIWRPLAIACVGAAAGLPSGGAEPCLLVGSH